MRLEPGARLGAYEIVAPIGAGGMGEVYRARDPRLGRDIAIKVLPPDAAPGDERHDRFEREARAIASLNHPGIVTIHAVEEAGGVPFFTMEFVEGRSLDRVIPTHGLPVDELLRIAVPLADAVAAAHQRGILHRDLKPGNVMITPEGRVKVLDFGLAKLLESVARPPGGAASLITTSDTGEGRILGTVAYMSPEQAEGKPLDQRSDVFSLGVILYEMATGQRPFRGDTNVSVLSAILKDTPGSITELRPELPRDVSRIVKRALAKDPELRYQTVKDLRNDLAGLKEDLATGEVPASDARQAAARSRAQAPRTRLRWVAAFAAAGALLALGAVAWRMAPVREAPAPEAPRPFDDTTITRLTADGAAGLGAAVSPDARYVAYAFEEQGRQGVRVRQTDTSATVQVVAPGDVRIFGLDFTPDGNRLAYLAYPVGSGTATLFEVPVLGGPPRKLLDDVDRGVSYSPDGARFAFLRGYPLRASAILVANADGSGERVLAERKNPDEFVLARPAWSPDGRVIVAAAWQTGSPKASLVEVDAQSGAARTIVDGRWDDVTSVCWLPSGAGLLVTAADFAVNEFNQVWFVDYPGGRARRITSDLAGYTRVSVSADGRTIAAVRGEYEGAIWVAPASNPGRPSAVPGVAATPEPASIGWTPDGRILFGAVAGNNSDVWAARPDGSDVRQLTTSPEDDHVPVASRDGRHIVFVSTRGGKVRLWRMNPDGTGQAQLTDGHEDVDPVVSADSAYVYYTRGGMANKPAHRVPVGGGPAEPAFGTVPPGAAGGIPSGFMPDAFSPDGSVVLGKYWDQQAGTTRVAVVRADGSGAPRVLDIPSSPGVKVSRSWAPDGRAVTTIREEGGASSLWRLPIDGGAPSRLAVFPPGERIVSHAWSLDGRFLAMIRTRQTRDIVIIRDARR